MPGVEIVHRTYPIIETVGVVFWMGRVVHLVDIIDFETEIYFKGTLVAIFQMTDFIEICREIFILGCPIVGKGQGSMAGKTEGTKTMCRGIGGILFELAFAVAVSAVGMVIGFHSRPFSLLCRCIASSGAIYYKEYHMRKADFEEKIQRTSESIQKCRDEIGKRVVGQQALIDGILMALIAGGHVLVEGVPGLAKTLAVKTVADVVDVEFRRLQFTPDLLPADLVGTLVYRQQSGEFAVRKGPVFTNIVLADEINRAPAKVQSALLESMEERQVTIGETTYPLPQPFFVLATQNPIEQEGTYPLPEAQLDRFMMKLRVVYPSHEEELMILRRMGVEREIEVNNVFSAEHLKSLRKIASAILVDERIEEYIVQIVTASRAEGEEARSYGRFIDYGGSTRGTLFLYRCAKIKALFEGRTFVIPDDVKAVVFDVMRHRIVLSYEAESEELSPDDVIRHILKAVPVP